MYLLLIAGVCLTKYEGTALNRRNSTALGNTKKSQELLQKLFGRSCSLESMDDNWNAIVAELEDKYSKQMENATVLLILG